MCVRTALGLPLQLVADGESLHASHQARAQPLDRPRQLDLLDPRQQVAICDFHLHPRQVGAQTEVLSHAEGQMAVGLAVDPELEGRVEHVLVAVRRRVEEGQGVALADALAANADVFGNWSVLPDCSRLACSTPSLCCRSTRVFSFKALRDSRLFISDA